MLLGLASPVLALPKNAIELQSVIEARYAGDPNVWVERNDRDFCLLGSQNRADLLEQLLDDGLLIQRISTRQLSRFYICALKKDAGTVIALIAEPDSVARLESAASRWDLPLHYAVGRNHYANTLTLLENGASVWDKREAAIKNYTRDGHLLNAAVVALDNDHQDAVRALVDAGYADVVTDARDRGFAQIVGQLALGRDGKGGGLLGGLVDVAIAAALGGSATDFLIAGAASGLLDGESDASVSSPQNLTMRRRLARYLKNVELPAESPTKPPPGAEPALATPRNDVISELERLADLRDRGVLSDQEFEAMKARILNAD